MSCELERYVARCAEVVGDDGLSAERPDEHGNCTIQVDTPKFDPLAFSVEWKSLPATLIYDILDFSYKAEVASRTVFAAFKYAASPPDFEEGFEERQFLHYARHRRIALGYNAAELCSSTAGPKLWRMESRALYGRTKDRHRSTKDQEN